MRKAPELQAAFKPDLRDEQFLARLNDVLAPAEQADYEDLPEAYPTLHIIGVPRSGTTLLMQLVAAHLDVAYIDNLAAAFWRAPAYGLRLSDKLLGRRRTSTYESQYGRTSRIEEPHEFGRFWLELLGYDEMIDRGAEYEERIDWKRVSLVLRNMTHAVRRTVAFKSFLLAMHLRCVQELLPKTCWVRIRRDPTENALSLLQLRRQYLASEDVWGGIKPREFSWLKDEPVYRQVAGQVFYVEQAMTRQIEAVGQHNVLELRYDEVCANPRQALAAIQDLLARNGATVEMLSDPPRDFEIRHQDTRGDETARKVCEAVREFYQELETAR